MHNDSLLIPPFASAVMLAAAKLLKRPKSQSRLLSFALALLSFSLWSSPRADARSPDLHAA